MHSPFALSGERVSVRLQDIPPGTRRLAAERAARKWKLGYEEYLELMTAAHEPRPHRPLLVDAAKVELVMAGKTVPGEVPELPPNDPWVRR